MAVGGNFQACSTSGCSKSIVERDGCDDTTGDGIGDVRFTEVWSVDPCGGEPPQLLGTWRDGDFTQPYTPVNPVDCPTVVEESPGEPCVAAQICARFSGISGPDEWTMPEAVVESLTLSIVCGPVTVVDCAGEQTVVNEGCGSVSWSAPPPGASCEPRVLCTPFTVQVPDGSAVYLNWTEVGCAS